MIGSILTKAEVQELTGRKQRAACIRQLVREGVKFRLAADGWPRIHESELLSENVVSLRDRRQQEPDLDALAS